MARKHPTYTSPIRFGSVVAKNRIGAGTEKVKKRGYTHLQSLFKSGSSSTSSPISIEAKDSVHNIFKQFRYDFAMVANLYQKNVIKDMGFFHEV